MTSEAIQQKILSFFSNGTAFSVKKGEVLITPDSSIQRIFFLQEGHIRQFLITDEGQDLTLHLFKPMSYFPIMIILGEKKNKYTFEALTDAKGFFKPSAEVIAFLHKEPDVLFDLATRLSLGIIGLLEKIEASSYTKAYEKIVSLLKYLITHYGEQEKELVRISLKLTHTDLASWTGVQRETVSRQIEKLKKQGILSVADGTIVINPKKLADVHPEIDIKPVL